MTTIDLTGHYLYSDEIPQLFTGLRCGIKDFISADINSVNNTSWTIDNNQYENEEYIKLLSFIKDRIENHSSTALDALSLALNQKEIYKENPEQYDFSVIDTYLTDIINDIFINQINVSINVDSVFKDLNELKILVSQYESVKNGVKYFEKFLQNQVFNFLDYYKSFDTNYYTFPEVPQILEKLGPNLPNVSSFNFVLRSRVASTSQIFTLKTLLEDKTYIILDPNHNIYKDLISLFNGLDFEDYIYVDVFYSHSYCFTKLRMYRLLNGSLKIIKSFIY